MSHITFRLSSGVRLLPIPLFECLVSLTKRQVSLLAFGRFGSIRMRGWFSTESTWLCTAWATTRIREGKDLGWELRGPCRGLDDDAWDGGDGIRLDYSLPAWPADSCPRIPNALFSGGLIACRVRAATLRRQNREVRPQSFVAAAESSALPFLCTSMRRGMHSYGRSR